MNRASAVSSSCRNVERANAHPCLGMEMYSDGTVCEGGIRERRERVQRKDGVLGNGEVRTFYLYVCLFRVCSSPSSPLLVHLVAVRTPIAGGHRDLERFEGAYQTQACAIVALNPTRSTHDEFKFPSPREDRVGAKLRLRISNVIWNLPCQLELGKRPE